MSKVYKPVPAVKVPLLVIPLLNANGEFPELFQVAPVLIVTRPIRIFVPVVDDTVRLPLVPPPTVVVPVTVKAKPPTVKVVPSPTLRLPLIVNPVTVVVVTVPLRVKLPLIVVVPVCKTSVPLPFKERL